MKTESRTLIVNADDFGQSAGVNEGIIQSFERGILTSASLMVRYPLAQAAADYALKNNLGIGLHVDLGEWYLDGEEWKPLYEVVPVDDESAVSEELEKQIESFRKLTGKNPTHIDSHQHVHLRESIRHIFISKAKKMNVTLRRCSSLVSYCGDFYGQNTDSSPNHSAIGVENLKKIITSLPGGITEMACHPGNSIDFPTMYKTERTMEVKSLCDTTVRTLISDSKIELKSFDGLSFG